MSEERTWEKFSFMNSISWMQSELAKSKYNQAVVRSGYPCRAIKQMETDFESVEAVPSDRLH